MTDQTERDALGTGVSDENVNALVAFAAYAAARGERVGEWPAFQAGRNTVIAERNELRARIDKALACYGQGPDPKIGQSRWRSADEFLTAIRAALTGEGSGQ